MSDLLQIDGLAPLKNGARKTSKVMLLFPPEWVPTAPYLALPSLTAVLREAGHTVIQRDINIEMYDHFFTTEFMIWVRARQSMQLKALQMKEKRGELTDQEAGQLSVLEQMMTIDVFDLAARAEEAKTVVRGEQFYDAAKLERALNTFREAMQYISAAYYPASLVFYPMESNLGYRPGVSKEAAGLPGRRAGKRVPRHLQSACVAVGEQGEAGRDRHFHRHADAADCRHDVLQDDQGDVPTHTRGGRGERHYSASGRAAASRPILYGSLRLGDSLRRRACAACG